MPQNSLLVQIPPGSQPQQMPPQSIQGNIPQAMPRNGVRKMTPKGGPQVQPQQIPRMVQPQGGQPMPQPSFQNAAYMPQVQTCMSIYYLRCCLSAYVFQLNAVDGYGWARRSSNTPDDGYASCLGSNRSIRLRQPYNGSSNVLSSSRRLPTWVAHSEWRTIDVCFQMVMSLLLVVNHLLRVPATR